MRKQKKQLFKKIISLLMCFGITSNTLFSPLVYAETIDNDIEAVTEISETDYEEESFIEKEIVEENESYEILEESIQNQESDENTDTSIEVTPEDIIEDEQAGYELIASNDDQSLNNDLPYLHAVFSSENTFKNDYCAIIQINNIEESDSLKLKAEELLPEKAVASVLPIDIGIYDGNGAAVVGEEYSAQIYGAVTDMEVTVFRNENNILSEIPVETGDDDTGSYIKIFTDKPETIIVASVTDKETESKTEAQTETAITETENITEKESENIEAQSEEATEQVTEAATEEVTEQNTEVQTEETSEQSTEQDTEATTEEQLSESEEETEETVEAESDTTEEETESISETEESTESNEFPKTLTFSGNGYSVEASFYKEAEIPDDAYIKAEEILPGTEEYQKYLLLSDLSIDKEGISALPTSQARFFDISIVVDGEDGPVEIEPKSTVNINIKYDDTPVASDSDSLNVLHFKDESDNVNDLEISDTLKDKKDDSITGISFETDSFSIFGIIDSTPYKTTLVSNGEDYGITVEYSNASLITADANLDVEEITEDDPRYESYKNSSIQTADLEYSDSVYLRLFDISIVDDDGVKMQPSDGHSVSVEISLSDISSEQEPTVVHFGENTEVIDSMKENDTVCFNATSFSVYAVIEAEGEVHASGWEKVSSLSEFADVGLDGLYVGHISGYYLTDSITNISSTRTGITKTATSAPWDSEQAKLYYFEQTDDDKFYIYCLSETGAHKYVKQNGNSLLFTNDVNDATAFLISNFDGSNTVFRIQGDNNYCFNMQAGTNGKSIAAYNNLNDVNAKFYVWKYIPAEDDPFNIDGKVYGLSYLDGDITATGLVESMSGQKFNATQLTLRPDVLEHTGVLSVSGDVDVADWIFENIESNNYYVTIDSDSGKKYLSIKDDGLYLLSEPDPTYSVITINSGTNSKAGKFQLSCGRNALVYSGSINGGFVKGSITSNNSWLTFLEKSDLLNDDDFVKYTAHKVNVSDRLNVDNGKSVVIYTTIWNEDTLKYDYYIIDYNGNLIKCNESGGTISWFGNQINTALWTFTEYYYDDGTPNHYYELQNEYSNKYIAPQFRNGQILSDNKIGINLNGRRYGDSHTTAIAWDDKYYSYAGLKVANVDGTLTLTSGSLSEAQDLYFAIMEEVEHEELTTIETVDNNVYGIKMSMINWNNIVDGREATQIGVLGRDTNADGLLQKYLEDDGYPLTNSSKTGKPQTSLGSLFSDVSDVNHLFIKDIYEANGYFEFNSTKNFAHLNEDGNFTVYDQLAAIGTPSGPTRTHGQFMPYNMIQEGVYAPATNQTDVLANPLSDLDPRKGELLYMIPQDEADYFFGMEMEAGFVQTDNGLDAWGHDIIFEFSGDDDFWLYVDGQLVLDLGGVHSASTGTINFKTGDVHIVLRDLKGVIASRTRDTTLYNIFRENYISSHPNATSSEISEYLNSIFKLNNDGQYVFKDHSTHTMKMFYMERGAGASNLSMRFNLSSVKPGTILLEKNVVGTAKPDYLQADFPYQIYYKIPADGSSVWHLLDEKDENNKNRAVRKDTNIVIPYANSYTPLGTDKTYDNVFFLKPGEVAEIKMPDDTIEYKVVECGINQHIYDSVKINDEDVVGTDDNDDDYFDYETTASSIEDRSKVVYENHVKDTAIRTLSIQKVLYDYDGETILDSSMDDGSFGFRLYLGSENDSTLSAAYMREYYVKNEEMEYCSWDADSESFVSTGKKHLELFSEQELQEITFVTSPNGSISKIPAGHSIEIRDVVIGTKFRVEERDNEIPKGYERIGYDRGDASYIVEDETKLNEGTVRDNSDPFILVKNRRGWGLSVIKEWSDSSFVENHSDINLAVFCNGNLVPDTLKTLEDGETSLYWFIETLEPGTTFDDYEVREVIVSGDTVTAIDDGNTAQIYAVSKGSETPEEFTYTVSYEKGEPDGLAENVRTDIVSNIRDGIKFVKTDMRGNPLAGSHFVIKDENENVVGEPSYTSSANGLITIAYLSDGTYTLEETESAAGYIGLRAPLTITVTNGVPNIISNSLTDGLYSLTTSENMYVISIKNKPFTLKAVKEDVNGNVLSDAHFGIYRRIRLINGSYRKDYYPVPGFEDLVSDENGIISSDLELLGPGTYYMTETISPAGYDTPETDVLFTINKNGIVTIQDNDECILDETDDETSIRYVYTIRAINSKVERKLRLVKVDLNNTERVLSGAIFDLYETENGIAKETPLYTNITSDSNGILHAGDKDTFVLNGGVYILREKRAPVGYYMKSQDVIITITKDRVMYDEGTGLSSSGSGITYDVNNKLYTILISNERIPAVPYTGINVNTEDSIRLILVVSLIGLYVLVIISRKKKKLQ